MILLGLLLSLAAPSRAQVAPAAGPAPVGQVDERNLDEVFKRFTSGKPMLPTLKEVQAEQLKRDLAAPLKRDEAAVVPSGAGIGLFSQPPRDGVRRDTTERVDVTVSRPVSRVELGVGVSEEDIDIGRRRIAGGQSAYGFVSLDLSKIPLKRKLFHSPTATHSEVVLQDDRVQVSKDEYTVDFLKHPAGGAK
ncbi:MAG TPA: hypothetical protein VN915_07905 [Elusimicrobiota bacterium]|nr:hypothetical protein [Elusimicrobiota bacterium]